MTLHRNHNGRNVAARLGLAVITIALASVLIFSLGHIWSQSKVAFVLGMYVIATPLFEYGGTGRWLPALSPARGRLHLLVHTSVLVAGLALLLLALGFCFALGTGNLRSHTASFVLGLYPTSLALIRYGVSGKWFIVAPAEPAHADASAAV